eukprot:symbB.v1.2.021819.t1/scaffold1908.1/size96406/3
MVALQIQSVSGQRLDVDVEICEKIFDVKLKIEELWGVPPSCQRLVNDTEEYVDTYLLKDLGDSDVELTCLITLQHLCLQLSRASSVERAAALHELQKLRGFAAALDAAEMCLQDRNAYVRAIAVDVIIRVANAETAQNLIERMLRDEPRIGVKLLGALGSVGGSAATVRRLRAYFDSRDVELRRAAVDALTTHAHPGDHGLLTLLLQMLHDPDRDGFESVKLCALRVLRKMCPMNDGDMEVIASHLADANSYIRAAAADIVLSSPDSARRFLVLRAVLMRLQASNLAADVQASLLSVLCKLELPTDDQCSEKKEVVLILLELAESDPELQHSMALLLLRLVPGCSVELEGLSEKAYVQIWRSALDWLESTDASSGEVKRCQRMRDKLLELPIEIDKDSRCETTIVEFQNPGFNCQLQ